MSLGLPDVSDHPLVNGHNEPLAAFLARRGIRSTAFMGVENVFREVFLAPVTWVAVLGTLAEGASIERDGYRDGSALVRRLVGTKNDPIVAVGAPAEALAAPKR